MVYKKKFNSLKEIDDSIEELLQEREAFIERDKAEAEEDKINAINSVKDMVEKAFDIVEDWTAVDYQRIADYLRVMPIREEGPIDHKEAKKAADAAMKTIKKPRRARAKKPKVEAAQTPAPDVEQLESKTEPVDTYTPASGVDAPDQFGIS